MPFSDHIEGLLQREGGYVNNPADRGGETNYGITKATARANGYAGQMRDLPRATAIQIYKRQYWAAARLDEVDAIAPRLAGKLFDIGVNAGPARAGRFLQRALNYFVGGLAVDGKIGPATLAALHALAKKRGPSITDKNLLRVVNGLLATHYVEIVEANASQRVFAWGWANGRLGV